jgi:D-3-phosphoglycerate dehydrogenase / 2-oxoglutarate reductase
VLPWPIHRLSTLRVGVVGLGRIGSTFARSIKPFVRDVVGFDPFLAASQLEAKNVTPTSLESLFETSDIISLHLPLSEKTRHLVSTRTIALMKRKPIIINVSRGGLIDGGALANALKRRTLWRRHRRVRRRTECDLPGRHYKIITPKYRVTGLQKQVILITG